MSDRIVSENEKNDIPMVEDSFDSSGGTVSIVVAPSTYGTRTVLGTGPGAAANVEFTINEDWSKVAAGEKYIYEIWYNYDEQTQKGERQFFPELDREGPYWVYVEKRIGASA